MLFRSPVSKPYLKASVKSITDLKIDEVGYDYFVTSMRIYDDRCLMTVKNLDKGSDLLYEAYLNQSTAKYLITSISASNACASQDTIFTYRSRLTSQIALRRTLNSILANISITGRRRSCNAGWHISGRWCQHHGDEIYAIDDSDRLQVIRWPDIEAGDYACNRVVDGGVEEFCVAAGRRAVLYVDGSMRVDGRPASNMHAARGNVECGPL